VSISGHKSHLPPKSPYLTLEWTSLGTQLLLAFYEVCKLKNKITYMHMKDKINTMYGIK
jgi:hypothetical protein